MKLKERNTSSGTARILLKPFLKATNTFLAPHLKADVAQSNAVSPAPKTTTIPVNLGYEALQPHMPGLLALATNGKNDLDV